MPRLPRFFAAATLAALAGRCGPLAADQLPPGMGAVAVMADLTLIDGTCRNVVVNFGPALRFAAAQGVAETALMPGGSRRAEFEAVLRARQAALDRDELCGVVAKNYMEALPASVEPITVRDDPK